MKPNESLARFTHDLFCRWMELLLSNCIETGDDCQEIPRPLVERISYVLYSDFEQLSPHNQEFFKQEAVAIQKIFIGDDSNDSEGQL